MMMCAKMYDALPILVQAQEISVPMQSRQNIDRPAHVDLFRACLGVKHVAYSIIEVIVVCSQMSEVHQSVRFTTGEPGRIRSLR